MNSSHNNFDGAWRRRGRVFVLWTLALLGGAAVERNHPSRLLRRAASELAQQASTRSTSVTTVAGLTDFDVDGAGTAAFQGSGATCINALGDVGGIDLDANNVAHGFLRTADGTLINMDIASAGTAAGQGTFVLGVNAARAVVGFYIASDGSQHSFLHTADGVVRTFETPDSTWAAHRGTTALAINESGVVVGTYTSGTGSSTTWHGFVRSTDGTFTEFNAPGAGAGNRQGTRAVAINASGDIAGTYSDASGVFHGFVRSAAGVFTTFDVPGSGTLAASSNFLLQGTVPLGLNDAGVITGMWADAAYLHHGFVRAADGTIASFDAPNAGTDRGLLQGTYAVGLNASGVVVGFYQDTADQLHGFVRSAAGAITSFDASEAGSGETRLVPLGTLGVAINASGTVAGFYLDSAARLHGVIAAASATTAQTATPTFSLDSGSYSTAQTLTIRDATPGASIYYTIDGSTPTTSSSVYSAALTIDASQRVSAIAVANGFATSNVASSSYAMKAACPRLTPGGGTYSAVQTVTIASATPEATIYYTTDGTAPTSSAKVYSAPLTVDASQTLRAIAVRSGYATSPEARAGYVLATPKSWLWVWMSGTSTAMGSSGYLAQTGVYGTLDVAAAANTPGGRMLASTWSDGTGAFWLFGGLGLNPSNGQPADYNDLWRYDPTATLWTWMGGSNATEQSSVLGTRGVAASGNVPAARAAAATWLDAMGNLWLFGGYQAASNTELADLWQLDTSSMEWAWLRGQNLTNTSGAYGTQGAVAAENTPGARHSAATWLDTSGNLWLYGGLGYDGSDVYGYLNDLWQFDSSRHAWRWMTGCRTLPAANKGCAGSYAGTGSTPGGRSAAAAWSDEAGNFWLYGGLGYDGSGVYGYLNDLWRFSPASGEWTWIGGAASVGCSGCAVAGVYGLTGTASAWPGGRQGSVAWRDGAGNFWLYGGWGADVSGTVGWLDDVWKFDRTTQQWVWSGGSPYVGQTGLYGNYQVASVDNLPGARYAASGWKDASGNFWLFGGRGYDGAYLFGYLNDLWNLRVKTLPLPALSWTTPTSIVYGTALNAAQLNATASASGTLSYDPPAGTVLSAGTHTLSVTFTPSDTSSFSTVTASVSLNVVPAGLSVTAANVASNYGAAIPPLNGTLSGVVAGDDITASYVTVATASSPPGSYAITPVLNDPNGKLGNYTVTSTAGTLVIYDTSIPTPLWLSTSTVTAGSGAFTLTVAGVNFSRDAVVLWNGLARATVYVGSGELQASILASDVASEQTVQVAVATSSAVSAALPLAVQSTSPTPVVRAASLAEADATGARQLGLVGTGFLATSSARWNGVDQGTVYLGPGNLGALLGAANYQALPIVVYNGTQASVFPLP